MSNKTGKNRRLLLWAVMGAMIFWTLVYRLSIQGGELPEFIYVNF